MSVQVLAQRVHAGTHNALHAAGLGVASAQAVGVVAVAPGGAFNLAHRRLRVERQHVQLQQPQRGQNEPGA